MDERDIAGWIVLLYIWHRYTYNCQMRYLKIRPTAINLLTGGYMFVIL